MLGAAAVHGAVELLADATPEEVAAELSRIEGRPVSVEEVRRIEAAAVRKLRKIFTSRGLTLANLLPED